MGDSDPLVTIIILPCKGETRLEEGLSSLFNQTFNKLEIVIIDRGSDEVTRKKIQETTNQPEKISVEHFFKSDNETLGKTLNRIWGKTKGEYVVVVTSNDVFLPFWIEKSIAVFKGLEETFGVVYSDGFIVNSKGEKIDRYSNRFPVPIGKNIHQELLLGNWIPTQSVLIKRSCFTESDLFDEDFETGHYGHLLKISKNNKFFYVTDPLFHYRVDEGYLEETEAKIPVSLALTQYPALKKFNLFIELYRKRSLRFLFYLSFFNVELLIRSKVRQLQNRFKLMNLSCPQFLFALFEILLEGIAARLKYYLNLMTGLTIGRGSRIHGKIIVSGSRKNIKLGKSVRIVGNVTFVTEPSRKRMNIFVGDGTTIYRNATLFCHGGNITIGKNCFIGPGVHIQGGGDIFIGDNTMIAANTMLFASNHVMDDRKKPFIEQGEKFIGISIGQNCWISTSVVVLDGVVLGENCVVGANCVLRGSYPKDSKIVSKSVLGSTV